MNYKEYLVEKGIITIPSHLLLEKSIDSILRKFIDKFKLINVKWWNEVSKWTITDPLTQSTFLAADVEEAKQKLAHMRKSFGYPEPVYA